MQYLVQCVTRPWGVRLSYLEPYACTVPYFDVNWFVLCVVNAALQDFVLLAFPCLSLVFCNLTGI